ncbi:hypothetical protein F5Y15DRAFT_363302 [Xylariaceae sp. FL0016]|nr:hypothetical protein F5Y15DRAFT_363302 [Xylariaceae sp. FL0016]
MDETPNAGQPPSNNNEAHSLEQHGRLSDDEPETTEVANEGTVQLHEDGVPEQQPSGNVQIDDEAVPVSLDQGIDDAVELPAEITGFETQPGNANVADRTDIGDIEYTGENSEGPSQPLNQAQVHDPGEDAPNPRVEAAEQSSQPTRSNRERGSEYPSSHKPQQIRPEGASHLQREYSDGFAQVNDNAPAPSDLVHRAIFERNAEVLCQQFSEGAYLEISDTEGKKPLYLAVETDWQEGVELLLRAGADIESFNPLSPTHFTALHRAVGGNHLDITEILLQGGANVDAPNQNHRTSLQAAVIKRNLDMVHLLLRYGANKDVVDNTGATTYSLAKGSEEILGLLQGPQLLQGPPNLFGTPSRNHMGPFAYSRGPKYDEDKMIACHSFRATIVDFYVGSDSEYRMEKSVSVYELLYGTKTLMEPPQRGSLAGRSRDFRWFHLPVNNIEWVKDLLTRRLNEEDPTFLSDDFKSAASLTGSHERHHCTPNNPSAFMRPTHHCFNIKPDGGESTHQQIVAFVPYLHFETLSRQEAASDVIKGVLVEGSKLRYLKRQARGRGEIQPDDPSHWSAKDSITLYNHLLLGYLASESTVNAAGPMQPRRTLDQYFYTHLDTSSRDKDQVVSRYMKRSKANEPKLFMVDQLWLWVINADTVISCAPVGIENLLGDGSSITPSIQRPPPMSRPPVNYSRQPAIPLHVPQAGQSYAWMGGRHHAGGRDRTARRLQNWLAGVPFPQQPQRHIRLEGQESVEPYHAGHEENEVHTLEMKYRPMNVKHNIFRHLQSRDRAQIRVPNELASFITNHCANVFNETDIPPEFHFFDFFERSIGRVSDRVAQLLYEFQLAASVNYKEVHAKLDIQSEAELLVEIEDIHDELLILKMVLKDQQVVLKSLSDVLDPQGHDQQKRQPYAQYLSVKENRLLGSHLHRVDMMENMTRKTAKTVGNLLVLSFVVAL